MPTQTAQPEEPSVYLFWPGLLTPPASPEALPPDGGLLSRILSRADCVAPTDVLQVAESAAGPLSYLADFDKLPDDACWCCEPVHLRSDMSQVRLFDTSHFALEHEEAEALVTAFNRHFSPEGLHLAFKQPQRWYLSGLPPMEPAPLAPRRLDGKNMHAFMPSQDALKTLLNETQMLFHAHEVNRQREARGDMVVNGVWLYGAGQLPDCRMLSWSAVYSNASVYQGLARYCSLAQADLPETPDIDTLAARSPVLVHSDQPASAAVEGLGTWLEVVVAAERFWLAPLVDAVRGGRLKTLLIDPGDGVCYRIHRGALRRFWRRRKPLSHWVGRAA